MDNKTLVVGFKYETRKGDIVKITSYLKELNYPFIGSNGCDYTEDGRYNVNIETDDDIIRSVPQ